MRLASARELKETVSARLRGSFLTEAEPVSGNVPTRPTKICSVGLGVTCSARSKDYKLAVRPQRKELLNSPIIDRIRSEARGEVDVKYIGMAFPAPATVRAPAIDLPWYTQTVRPLEFGTAISDAISGSGTLGAFVYSQSDASIYILSNGHVIARENDNKNDPVIQTSRYYGGDRPANIIATLERSVRLQPQRINYADAAIAKIASVIDINLKNREIGKISGLGPKKPMCGSEVIKFGSTTGCSHGHITAMELDGLCLAISRKIYRFNNLLEITGKGAAFSDDGDSGSVILDANEMTAIALLFGHIPNNETNPPQVLTLAFPIHTVLQELNVDLVL